RGAQPGGRWAGTHQHPHPGGRPHRPKAPTGVRTARETKPRPRAGESRRPTGENVKNSAAIAPAERRKPVREIVDMTMAFPIVRMVVLTENDRRVQVVPH